MYKYTHISIYLLVLQPWADEFKKQARKMSIQFLILLAALFVMWALGKGPWDATAANAATKAVKEAKFGGGVGLLVEAMELEPFADL